MDRTRLKFKSRKVRIRTQNASLSEPFLLFLKDIWIPKYGCSLKSAVHARSKECKTFPDFCGLKMDSDLKQRIMKCQITDWTITFVHLTFSSRFSLYLAGSLLTADWCLELSCDCICTMLTLYRLRSIRLHLFQKLSRFFLCWLWICVRTDFVFLGIICGLMTCVQSKQETDWTLFLTVM